MNSPRKEHLLPAWVAQQGEAHAASERLEELMEKFQTCSRGQFPEGCLTTTREGDQCRLGLILIA